MKNRLYKTQGIIIKRFNYQESDKIITLLTKYHGKITVIGKGIRKINSRKAPHLELFNHIDLFLAVGRSMDIITEVKTLEIFPHLRTQLTRTIYAYKIVEEIDKLCPDGQKNTQMYLLLYQFLKTLDKIPLTEIKDLVDKFTLEFLWELGFLPRNQIMTGSLLENILINVIEKKLNSSQLVNKFL